MNRSGAALLSIVVAPLTIAAPLAVVGLSCGFKADLDPTSVPARVWVAALALAVGGLLLFSVLLAKARVDTTGADLEMSVRRRLKRLADHQPAGSQVPQLTKAQLAVLQTRLSALRAAFDLQELGRALRAAGVKQERSCTTAGSKHGVEQEKSDGE